MTSPSASPAPQIPQMPTQGGIVPRELLERFSPPEDSLQALLWGAAVIWLVAFPTRVRDGHSDALDALTGDKANELVMIVTESRAWPLKSVYLYLCIIYKYKYLSTGC